MKCLFFAISVVLTFSTATDAWAIRQYRCEGRIQYRPCDEPFRGPTGIGMGIDTGVALRAQARLPKPNGPLFAEVLESRFERLSAREGIWRGRIRGNGLVRLRLEIVEGAAAAPPRFMGHVPLANKATWFAFRSVAPAGKNWTWRIIAESRPI